MMTGEWRWSGNTDLICSNDLTSPGALCVRDSLPE